MELIDAMESRRHKIVAVRGEDVYGRLKFGLACTACACRPHQAQGRIHTSVASIVVIPEVGKNSTSS
jgi:peptide chain release factor 1